MSGRRKSKRKNTLLDPNQPPCLNDLISVTVIPIPRYQISRYHIEKVTNVNYSNQSPYYSNNFNMPKPSNSANLNYYSDDK